MTAEDLTGPLPAIGPDVGPRAKAMVLALIVLAGFAVAVGYAYVQGAYLGRPYPESTFLFVPEASFKDFRVVLNEARDLKPYLRHGSAQYPLLALTGYMFGKIRTIYALCLYIALFACAMVALGWAFLKHGQWYERAIAVTAIALLNYGFLIAVDRGNFEGLVAVLVLACGYFFARKHYEIAAVLLALAAAMKLLPIILLVLFVAKKQYRAAAFCVTLTGLLTLASLAAFKGGIIENLSFLLHGSNITANATFGDFTAMNTNVVQRGVALITLLKIVHFQTGGLSWTLSAFFTPAYLVFAAIVLVALSAHVIFVEDVLWKQAAVMVFAMLVLPTISADYKLLYVLLPAYLFIGYSDSTSRLDSVYLGLFGLLLIPKSYYYFQNVFSEGAFWHDISIGVVINIVAMIVFCLLIVASGLRGWLLRRRGRNSPDAGAPDILIDAGATPQASAR